MLKPEDFDEAFERYLKDRFKPFRDKELPSDYGKNLSPSRTKHEFVSVVSLAPSPSGDMLAAVTGNSKDIKRVAILARNDSEHRAGGRRDPWRAGIAALPGFVYPAAP